MEYSLEPILFQRIFDSIVRLCDRVAQSLFAPQLVSGFLTESAGLCYYRQHRFDMTQDCTITFGASFTD